MRLILEYKKRYNQFRDYLYYLYVKVLRLPVRCNDTHLHQ